MQIRRKRLLGGMQLEVNRNCQPLAACRLSLKRKSENAKQLDSRTVGRMNRKGDIPITVLVVGVFAVCALALFTFFVADFEMSNSFVGLKIMEEMNSQIDEYLFYKNSGKPEGILNQLFPIIVEDGVEYIKISKSSKSTFGFFGDDEELLFSVRYPTP